MPDRRRVIGTHVARYGLVVVLLWIGGMKFAAYEVQGIDPLVAKAAGECVSARPVCHSPKFQIYSSLDLAAVRTDAVPA
jgi:hypothetical protein